MWGLCKILRKRHLPEEAYFGSVTLHWMIFSSPQAAWTITLTLGLQLRRKQKKKKQASQLPTEHEIRQP